MKERILRLCKRMKKCSLEELSLIADDINEPVIELILMTLIAEKKLYKINDTYIFIKPPKQSVPDFFKYYSKSQIDLAIKCFCLKITAANMSMIANIGENVADRFYIYFRDLLYKKQFQVLQQYYNKKPQQCRYRIFFDKKVYFYIYKSNVYLADTPLGKNESNKFTKEEVKEFKIIYSYLTRVETHNKNRVYLYPRLAEGLWRRNRQFNELYSELKSLISS